MSRGSSEFFGETADDSYFTTPSGHNNVTFVASSGDSGAGAEWPASSPDVAPSADFHDVTTSSNGYSAQKGYDLATGIGTPVTSSLIPYLVSYKGSTTSGTGGSGGSSGGSGSGRTGGTGGGGGFGGGHLPFPPPRWGVWGPFGGRGALGGFGFQGDRAMAVTAPSGAAASAGIAQLLPGSASAATGSVDRAFSMLAEGSLVVPWASSPVMR
jgi:hypothetical protein